MHLLLPSDKVMPDRSGVRMSYDFICSVSTQSEAFRPKGHNVKPRYSAQNYF